MKSHPLCFRRALISLVYSQVVPLSPWCQCCCKKIGVNSIILFAPCRLISTNGYVVVDDTNSPRFTSDAWPWVMNRSMGPPDKQKCTVDPYQRIDCGYLGISQFDCEGKVINCMCES